MLCSTCWPIKIMQYMLTCQNFAVHADLFKLWTTCWPIKQTLFHFCCKLSRVNPQTIETVVIYKALCFDVAQGRMNGAPNETRTSDYWDSKSDTYPIEWMEFERNPHDNRNISCSWYDAKLHPVAGIQFWSSGLCGIILLLSLLRSGIGKIDIIENY